MLVTGLTPYAEAATSTVGPVDPSTGFPFWVAAGDTRLDLCLDGPECLGTRADLVGPGGEAFWFNAAAEVAGAGASGMVEMATEAAFAGEGDQQIAFNRIRIRLDVSQPGTYTVAYPYGTKTYTVAAVDDQKQEIDDTADIGCLTAPCGDFAELADSGANGVGDSFLRWDPAVAPAAPAGYIGDGLTPHEVVGSPLGRNYVEVTRTHGADGQPLAAPEVAAREAKFAVQGRLARPKVVATPAGGSYAAGVTVRLVGSEPNAQIWYTTNGDAPADPDGTLTASAIQYTAPIELFNDTTLKAVNVVNGSVVTDPVTGEMSSPSSDTYVIDGTAPALTATPAGGTFGSAQTVTLTATDDKDQTPKIYYTKAQVATGGQDPTDPTSASTLYTGPIAVNGNTDGAETVIKAIAIDAAGNASPVVRQSYLINAASVSATPQGGSYGTAQDVTLAASDPDAAIYYTTDGQDPVVHQDPDTMAVTNVEHGTLYTNDPIHLTGYTTLKFLAVSAAGQSTVITEQYLIDVPENRGKGALGAVGPVDAEHGYPFWFGDKGSATAGADPVRLEICFDDPLCPVVADLPDTSKPRSFPDNFPDEAFWWSAEAAMDTGSGASALLVLAQEAAFGGTGDVAVGQQIAFSRLRIRIDDAKPFETYTVTTPYGVDVVSADDRGRVFFTDDIGCLAAPCDFTQALDGRVGPFLRWDPSVGPAAPAGYVGNPLVEHKVIGSPYGTNFFRIEGPDIGGPGVHQVQTDLFAVQGRIAQLRATASPQGGLYGQPQDVRIQASFPAEAKIVYTLDGSTPSVNADGSVANGQEFVPAAGDTSAAAVVTIPEGLTTLKFMAVDLATSKTSEVYTEDYRIEGALPTVTATPDPAAGPFQGSQLVTLSANTNSDTATTPPAIYYTTDGSTPRLVDGTPAGSTRPYVEPITVNRPTTVKAMAVSELGTVGPVADFTYVIHNLKAVGPVDPANGFPSWYEDFGNGTGMAPTRLELCLDDPLCPVIGELPAPDQPISFPGNFPDEAFWWSGDAEFDAGTTSARLVLAAEAAFANGPVRDGDQISFGRIRVDAENLVPGATYRITHPYGVELLTAEPDGSIFHTDDSGCLTGPCDFAEILKSPIGPFLRWDAGAPDGYLGDGATPHTVVGSPFGTNVFRMEQVTSGTGSALSTPVLVGQTDQFVVQGKIAALRASATPKGGTYTAAQQVTLSSNDPGAKIYYTTDGTPPTASSTLYGAPIPVSAEGTTTLQFVAIAADGSTSPVMTEVYTLDTVAPSVGADPAGGSYTTTQSVTLTSDDPTASIYYTVDGSTPTASSPAYTGPVQVSKNLTLKARAVDPAGNVSTIGSWAFTIGLPSSSLTLVTPLPATVDFGQATSLSGKLTSGGTALADRQVALQARPVGTTAWVGVGSATTLADGGYTFAGVTPQASSDYRVVFAGDAGYQASTSATQRVSVRALLTLNPLVAQVSRGKSVTYSGTLSPTHSGARITVTTSAPGQKTLTATATVTATGSWSVTTRAPGKEGTYTVIATWSGDPDHLAATSESRSLRVVK